MKRAILGVAVIAMFAGVSQAAIVVNEPFNYNDGPLVGNDPAIGGVWGTHSGTAGQVQVSGGKITLVHPTQSEDVNVPFEGGVAAGAGAILTANFDLTVPQITPTVNSVAFAHFLEGTSFFAARIWITAPSAGGSGFRLALSNDNSITDGDGEIFTGDLAFNTTYRITNIYDYSGAKGAIAINGGTPLFAADPGLSDEVGAYAFRESSANTTMVIDNLIVEMVVPEPATLGLLAGLSVVGLRRRSAR